MYSFMSLFMSLFPSKVMSGACEQVCRWTRGSRSSGVQASHPVESLPLDSLMRRSTNYVSHSLTPVQCRHPPPSLTPSLPRKKGRTPSFFSFGAPLPAPPPHPLLPPQNKRDFLSLCSLLRLVCAEVDQSRSFSTRLSRPRSSFPPFLPSSLPQTVLFCLLPLFYLKCPRLCKIHFAFFFILFFFLNNSVCPPPRTPHNMRKVHHC